MSRDGAKAWSAKIYGNAERTCTAEDWETNDATLDGCAQGISSGWKVYAPEKFYDAPVVYGATLDADGKLDFKAHAAFKSTRPMAASFALKQRGSTLAQGTFAAPLARDPRPLRRAASGAPVLTVTDAGAATSVDVAAAPS